MSLRTRVLPSLLNGISRQPPLLRAADQTEDELNTWSAMATGLTKRPPTEIVARLMNSASPDAFVHHINRDVSERYCVIIDQGTLRVFDIDTGEEQIVVAPYGFGYIASGKLRAVTVADYTFIVNTSLTCELGAIGDDLNVDQYSRWINRDGAGGMTQYPVNPTPGTYAGAVASMEKLPETAANGTTYQVSGSVDNNFVSYWVRRDGAVWNETVAFDQRNAIKSLTMPHALVREASGIFIFSPFSWAPRSVGDEKTNPPPTFIGRTISDVFFYQNRLGLLVDENVVFSCSGDFGNFWRNTVLDYVSSDVVDVAVATSDVALLRFALPFNDGIMLFSDQVQFSLENGENGLTPSSVSISPVTRYEINRNARPVPIGTEVYFCGDRNGATAVWEYTRIEQGDSLSAADITAHAPDLIPASIVQLIAAANSKALLGLTGGTDVYVYQFYWNGNDKILSAWRRWRFSYPIISGTYVDGYVLLVMSRPDGVFLVRMDLGDFAKAPGHGQQVCLDSRIALTGSYDGVSDRTTFVLPYAPVQSSFQMVRTAAHATRPDSLVDPSQYEWTSPTTVRVPGSEPTVSGGEAYDQRITFSRQFPLDYQGRPIVTGRLQLRTFTVTYAGTAYFRTEVQPYGSNTAPDVEEIVPAKLADFTGKIVGDGTLKLNRPVTHSGSYSFQVYGDAAQAVVSLSNPTFCPATFVSAEWEGFYFNRASQ